MCVLLLYWYLYWHSIITATTTTITTGIPNLISTDISEIKTTLHKNGKKLCKSIYRYNKPAYHLKDFCCTDYTFISTVLAKSLPDIIESKLILLYRGKYSCSSSGCSWSGTDSWFSCLDQCYVECALYILNMLMNANERIYLYINEWLYEYFVTVKNKAWYESSLNIYLFLLLGYLRYY